MGIHAEPGETKTGIESEARVRELLAPYGPLDELQIERKAVYRFHARVARQFRKGKAFLAGDAAHITPPFVGQGLVAGLRDAANLSWKLAWVLRDQASDAILDSYERERRPHALAMIGLAKFMGRLVMPRNRALALLTHGTMRLLQRIPPLRRYFEELGIKPQNRYRQGLFVRGRSAARLTRGGLLPQGWVRSREQAIVLSDEALGTTLTLIGFAADPASRLDADTARDFALAGGVTTQILRRGQTAVSSSTSPAWEDLHGTFMPQFVPPGWVVVVRPDRIIVHDGPVDDASRIVRESLECLRCKPHPHASLRPQQLSVSALEAAD